MNLSGEETFRTPLSIKDNAQVCVGSAPVTQSGRAHTSLLCIVNVHTHLSYARETYLI